MVAAGYVHSLARKTDGTVWAWGNNAFGQLGDGTTLQRNTPVPVAGLTSVAAVAAGGDTGASHSLAVKSDGTVWAWGSNYNGQIGDGTMADQHIPVQVPGLKGATSAAAGGEHSLAVCNGGVWAWGYNMSGQLGDGMASWPYSANPTQVAGLAEMTMVAAGCEHSLARRADGTVWTWGYNDAGQLGDGTGVSRDRPVQVTGLTGAVAIAGGAEHSLFLAEPSVVPQVAGTWPAEGSVERSVTRIIVAFDLPVLNVSADDLQIYGASITSVRGSGRGPYLFEIPDGLPEGLITATLDGNITSVEGVDLPAYQWKFRQHSTVICVDASAPAFGNGATWGTAFQFLQDALNAAVPGDEIRVAEGTYTPDRTAGTPDGTGDCWAAFQMKQGVSILGGYPAGGGDRAPATCATILSGDLNGDDGSNPADRTDNSYVVVDLGGTDGTTTLDGCIIRGGNGRQTVRRRNRRPRYDDDQPLCYRR